MVQHSDPKQMAKALRGELRARYDVDAAHSECLEIVARQHGVANWNVLAARRPAALPWGAAASTIPVLQIYSVDEALRFYVEFLGFTLDFGGPAGGPGTAYYGQLSRGATTLHVTEVAYEAGPGATVFIWIDGIESLRETLNARREVVPVWGPAVWAPELETAPWGARVLTIADPFGNHLRFNEPTDPAERAALPNWG
ncbi:glyoxalase superfamily protein [Asanoa sp. WMMD1127]|uniref:glyoxalase superfamily protein n=1 Tax=Asanoa sp. WMMD1127 TaxID=3016107 RepID=UPI0024160707|nr:glyoxalase superfamily protein [Asanoa sp. WMMD1127]MDG4827337.1 glyoxalase superfamily protein [Asanoa sp. WMMD1127]